MKNPGKGREGRTSGDIDVRLTSGKENRLAMLHSPHVVEQERVEDADATLELVREA